MTYPRDEEKFLAEWIGSCSTPIDEAGIELGKAAVQAINRAYYAGLEEGRKERAEDRDE